MSKKEKNHISVSLAASLPTFAGGQQDNFYFFLDKVNQLAKLEKWPTEKTLLVFKLNLKGDALNFLMNDSVANKTTDFTQLTKLFSEKYSKKATFEHRKIS